MQTDGKMPLPKLPQYPVRYRSVWMLWRIFNLPCIEIRFLSYLAHSLRMKAPLWRKKLHTDRVLKTCFMTSRVEEFEC